MEKPRRDNLRAVVAKARSTVEENLAGQLVGFGFFRAAEPVDPDRLPLTPERKALYPRLRDAVLREGRAVGKESGVSPEAVSRFVREAGATWVNRLASLRALETRGLLEPAAAFLSEDYGGASPRAARLREVAAAEGREMTREGSVRAGIVDACQELSQGVGVLFDLEDEHSLLWPDGPALRDVLERFSTDVTDDDWREPEVLGWVYQYYNTDANANLKKLKNSTTGFKLKADDVPIANQFYTPHWVVRLLTDNTLGRLWLEAQDRLPGFEGQPPRLHERRNSIPHAADEAAAFKTWFLEEPDPLGDETLDRLCRFLVPLPSRPLPRVKKNVREIRVLDPACGSGHFLLYAFDLLFVMYREGEPDLAPREIPSLILENNLFGVDIDLRAAQLAAFSLYLKARTTLARIDPEAHLEVRGLNVVVADAHIGNDPRKAAFLDRYKGEPEVQQLFAKVLSDLDHTNVLGSLLKVRTEFELLFGRVREAEVKKERFTLPGQQPLLDVARQKDLTETFQSFSGREWSINELLDELRRFEKEVVPSQDIGARLFLSDLERSVGLLSLLSRQYDVVLMNPPYGDMPTEAKDYLRGNKAKKIPAHYPRTHGDLYAAFIEQGLDLALSNGFLGALVPWTYTFLSSLAEIRTEILCGEARPELLQEYGYGVLDGATVGTVGTVARKVPPADRANVLEHLTAFDRLSEQKKDWEKQGKFLKTFPTYAAAGPNPEIDWFVARLASLGDVPGMPYAYWASDSLRSLFRKFPPLDSSQKGVLVPGRPSTKLADVKQGLGTADDSRFVRFWWEVPVDRVGCGRRWLPFVKGGRDVCFSARVDLLVNWDDGGREIYEYNKIPYGGAGAPIRNPQFYFRPGVTWPRVSWRLRKFAAYSEGCIFADKGSSIFGRSMSVEAISGLLNSSTCIAAMLMQTPERMWEIGLVSAVPIPVQPFPARASERVLELVRLHRNMHVGDETCRDFKQPELRQAWETSGRGQVQLDGLLRGAIDLRQQAERDIGVSLAQLDDEGYRLYGISVEDRAIVEREISRRSHVEPRVSSEEQHEAEQDEDAGAGEDSGVEGSEVEDSEVEDSEVEDSEVEDSEVEDSELGPSPLRTRDLVARWLSFYLKQILEADEDGIVPVWPTRTEVGLVARLKEAIQMNLGQEAMEGLVAEAPSYLGVADLPEWLSVSREESVEIAGKKVQLPVGFFAWHISNYGERAAGKVKRCRPLFWLLSSESFEGGKVRFRFQVYLHALKVTQDTLSRIGSHYLEPAIEDFVKKEWDDAKARAGRLEGKARALADNETQEWLNTLRALEAFQKAINEVIQGPPKAVQVATNAKWLARTIASVTGGQDLGHGYAPDVDFGVRVNLTPLARKGLLPKFALKKLGG